MKIKNIFFSLLISIISLHGFSQKTKIAKANKQYDAYSYSDAIASYESIVNKGYKDEQLLQKLGNAYYFNSKLEKAAKWYGELFAMNQEQETEYYYRYSQCLKAIGDYTKADNMLQQFNKKSGNDIRAKLFEKHKNYLKEIMANSGRYTVSNASINSEYSDYGGSFLGNKLIFASARDTGSISKRVFAWTNQSFTNLYSSDIKEDGSFSKPKPFEKKLNSKFHESSPVFTKDGKTMYFTRNNFLDGKKGEDNKNTTLLKLYKATLKAKTWGDVKELPFDSNEYSTAHPALSPDEKTLYFASDMPGTLGQSDLYKVIINEDGSFGAPINLGSEINTEGRETFPFVSEDNELYFSSDGQPGLGGLDIFVAKMDNNGNFKDVENIGAPINGTEDDFAFVIDKNRKGFFTSNRKGGLGYDDIYKFKETNRLVCEQDLSGVIADQETTVKLSGVKVSLFDEKLQILKGSLSDEKGLYNFKVECGQKYYIRAEKQDYETKQLNVIIDNLRGETHLSTTLLKQIKPVLVGTDLAKTVNIPNIYFNLDKSFIREDAAVELEKIVAIMKQYPAMKVDVRSYTDSRSSAKYNEVLSNQRAKATMDWLIENGIEASRLTSKGYGESQLVNHCSDGVECTEAEHQANRRSEFIVVFMR